MTLTAMTAFDDVGSFLADAVSRAHRTGSPRTSARAGDDPVAMWEGDVAYEDGDLDRAGGRHRLYMRRGGWFYEGTNGAS